MLRPEVWDPLELGLEFVLIHRAWVLGTKLYTLQEQCVLITEPFVACFVALESHTLLCDQVFSLSLPSAGSSHHSWLSVFRFVRSVIVYSHWAWIVKMNGNTGYQAYLLTSQPLRKEQSPILSQVCARGFFFCLLSLKRSSSCISQPSTSASPASTF